MDTSKYYKRLEELITKRRSFVGSIIVEIVNADDTENLIDEIIADYDELVTNLRDEIEKYETICDKINRLLP